MVSNRSEETDSTTEASADSQLTLEHPPGQVRDRHNETIHRFETKSQQTTHLMVSNQSTRTQTHFKREHKQMSTSHNKRHVMVSNQSRRTQKAPQRQAETFRPDSTSPAPSQ